MSRFGKVPEWLFVRLCELSPDERGDVAVPTAVAVFAVVATRHTDYRSGGALLDPERRRDVAGMLGLTERSVRRTVAVLTALGALVDCGQHRFTVQFDEPSDHVWLELLDGGVQPSDGGVQPIGRPRPLMVSVPAGGSANPSTSQRTELLPEQPASDVDDVSEPPAWARGGGDKLGRLRDHLADGPPGPGRTNPGEGTSTRQDRTAGADATAVEAGSR